MLLKELPSFVVIVMEGVTGVIADVEADPELRFRLGGVVLPSLEALERVRGPPLAYDDAEVELRVRL